MVGRIKGATGIGAVTTKNRFHRGDVACSRLFERLEIVGTEVQRRAL